MNYRDLAITVSELNQYVKNKIADDEFLNEIVDKYK